MKTLLYALPVLLLLMSCKGQKFLKQKYTHFHNASKNTLVSAPKIKSQKQIAEKQNAFISVSSESQVVVYAMVDQTIPVLLQRSTKLKPLVSMSSTGVQDKNNAVIKEGSSQKHAITQVKKGPLVDLLNTVLGLVLFIVIIAVIIVALVVILI